MPRATVSETANRLRAHVPASILRLLLAAPVVFGVVAILTMGDPVVATLTCEGETCAVREEWVGGLQERGSEFPSANLMEAQAARTFIHSKLPSTQVILVVGGERRAFPGFFDVLDDPERIANAIQSWVKHPVGRLEIIAGSQSLAMSVSIVLWLLAFLSLARMTHSWTLVLDRRSNRLTIRWPSTIGHEVRTIALKDLRDARPRYAWRQWFVELDTMEGRVDALGALATEQEAATIADRILRFRRAIADIPS